MRKNYRQMGAKGIDGRIYIEGDWYSHGISSNVVLGKNVYIDTSYGFAGFQSKRLKALTIGEGSGCYDRTSMIVSKEGKITVGKFTILNGTTLLCKKNIIIGNHCMLAWGSVLSDSWMNTDINSIEARRAILKKIAGDPLRPYPFFGDASPIILEDNCWVGFDSVILPGVKLGHGCVVGCKTIVDFDIPPYAVVTGSPARIVKYLTPDDNKKVRVEALKEYIKKA